MSFSLKGILAALDGTRIKYKLGRVVKPLPNRAIVELHVGTKLPESISGLGALPVDDVVFMQELHCCGKYGCTGNGKHSIRAKCSAVAFLVVKATGIVDQFRVFLDEPAEQAHGPGFASPAAPQWENEIMIIGSES
jgi:hypothetical protein